MSKIELNKQQVDLIIEALRYGIREAPVQDAYNARCGKRNGYKCLELSLRMMRKYKEKYFKK